MMFMRSKHNDRTLFLHLAFTTIYQNSEWRGLKLLNELLTKAPLTKIALVTGTYMNILWIINKGLLRFYAFIFFYIFVLVLNYIVFFLLVPEAFSVDSFTYLHSEPDGCCLSGKEILVWLWLSWNSLSRSSKFQIKTRTFSSE